MRIFPRLFSKNPVLDPNRNSAAANESSPDPAELKAATERAEEAGIAAVLEMSDGQELRRVAGLLDGTSTASAGVPNGLQRAARLRLSGLVDAGIVDLSELGSAPGTTAAWLAVAAGCRDASHLTRAIVSISDEGMRADLVVNGATSRIRQLAAQSIEAPHRLPALIKEVRGKDKNVYRILKQKSDALLAESRAAVDRASTALSVCELIEKHSRRPVDAGYAATYEELARRWQLLVHSSPGDFAELASRVAQAAETCQIAMAAQRQADAAEAARQAADASARYVAQQAAAEAQVLAERAAAIAAAETARLHEAAESEKAAMMAAEAVRQADAQRELRTLEALMRKADEALMDGATQRAAGLRRTIEDKISALAAVPPPLTRQVQQFDARLRELKQWKEFAASPKRAELIAAMEALVGSNEAPQNLARSIKELQQEWRTACKGVGTDMSAESVRFQRASQAAYQPCREWFEKQSQERQANLEHRRGVLARLQAFDKTVSGTSVEWRIVAQVLREAPQEWRRYFPVDREPGRHVQEEFDAALRQLQAKLDAWHETNVADKQQLVRRAQHLLSVADHRTAIESVKSLQALWKAAGPAPREQEQRLWTDFRQACDAIFQKSAKATADSHAAVEVLRLNAEALCEEAERVAADPAFSPGAAVTKVSELSAAFDGLTELPRGIGQGLAARLARVLEACRARVNQQRVQEGERSVADLLDAHQRVNAFGWSVGQGVDDAHRAILKEAVTSFMATVARWPTGGLQAIQQALASAGGEAGVDTKFNESVLRNLCVRGEILSGATTPPEDETLRRELQLRRLTQAMGQGNAAVHSDWETLVLEWAAAPAVAPALYDLLQTRFMQARLRRPALPSPASYPPAPRSGRTGERSGVRPERGAGRPMKPR